MLLLKLPVLPLKDATLVFITCFTCIIPPDAPLGNPSLGTIEFTFI